MRKSQKWKYFVVSTKNEDDRCLISEITFGEEQSLERKSMGNEDSQVST